MSDTGQGVGKTARSNSRARTAHTRASQQIGFRILAKYQLHCASAGSQCHSWLYEWAAEAVGGLQFYNEQLREKNRLTNLVNYPEPEWVALTALLMTVD